MGAKHQGHWDYDNANGVDQGTDVNCLADVAEPFVKESLADGSELKGGLHRSQSRINRPVGSIFQTSYVALARAMSHRLLRNSDALSGRRQSVGS